MTSLVAVFEAALRVKYRNHEIFT